MLRRVVLQKLKTISTEHSASNFMLSFPKDRGSEVFKYVS
jgi:hypothetical protein